VGDNSDAFPDDPSASIDTDGDGHPDRWNEGKDENDSTTGLKLDEYPEDPDKWDSSEIAEEDDNEVYILLAVAIIVCISLLVLISFVVRNRGGEGGEILSNYWDDVVHDRMPEGERLDHREMEGLLEEKLWAEEISLDTYNEIIESYPREEY
jgi:hypothetical protein